MKQFCKTRCTKHNTKSHVYSYIYIYTHTHTHTHTHVCMYCLYIGVDYTYIDINALAQGIKSFLSSHVWFQAVAGA